MAEKRMFTKKITDSDAFQNMPLSAQALYFHLNMAADDEGFVNNPMKIQRCIGAAIDDLNILVAKNFIIKYESGIIVIKHWKMHNYIAKDRFHKTDYTEERAMLEVKENGAYTLADNSLYTECIQIDDRDKNRLDKNSIEENRLDKGSMRGSEEVEEIVNLYKLHCPSLSDIKKITEKRKKSIKALLKAYTIEEIKEGFEKAEASDFCKGKGNQGWKADFDFLINQNNLAKVLEGKYDNREKPQDQSRVNRFSNA